MWGNVYYGRRRIHPEGWPRPADTPTVKVAVARTALGWAIATAVAAVLGSLALYHSPKYANRREHRRLEAVASHVDLSGSCERTGLVREGSAYHTWGKPPFITVTYWCSGRTPEQVREAVNAALQRGGFRSVRGDWSDLGSGKSGPRYVSTWNGHSSGLMARVSGSDVSLEFERPFN